MANTLKHTFTSPIVDEGDPNIVGPNEWNAEHPFAGGSTLTYLMWDAAQSDKVSFDNIWSRLPFIDITKPPYNAVGNGAVNDGPAIQSAITAALATNGMVYIPPASVGYRVDNPINITNTAKSLLVVGAGIAAPAFGLALTPPTGGSMILANTGTGKCVFDLSGSNNITFKDLNIKSIGQTTPSQVGFLMGTSTTSPAAAAPGGSNCSLENVAIYLNFNVNSVPVYFVAGAGLCHFTNLWTLGDYGVYLTANNELALTSTFVTFGGPIGVDGMLLDGCNLLGYGTKPVFIAENCHDIDCRQLYIATIFGGPGYTGQQFGIRLKNCTDIHIKVEHDYFPSCAVLEGICIGITLEGITFRNVTPIGVNDPIFVAFLGTSIQNSEFKLYAVTPTTSNYFYTTVGGASPTMQTFANCEFWYNTSASTFLGFLNATNTFSVPFFNQRFAGNSDTVTLSFFINGAVAGTSTYRYFLNGNKFGTA